MKKYTQLIQSNLMGSTFMKNYSSFQHMICTSRLFTTFTFKNEYSNLYENYNTHIHSKALKTTEISLSVGDNEEQFDRRNIHVRNQENHKKWGPIYKEQLGPDAKIVYVAEPSYVAKLFREGIQTFMNICNVTI